MFFKRGEIGFKGAWMQLAKQQNLNEIKKKIKQYKKSDSGYIGVAS